VTPDENSRKRFPTTEERNTVNNDDIVEINQVVGLYAHVIDGKQWHRLDELFTDDGVFDLSGLMGASCGTRASAIKRFLTSMPMPLQHRHQHTSSKRTARCGAVASGSCRPTKAQ
jgi:hypothetical protein